MFTNRFARPVAFLGVLLLIGVAPFISGTAVNAAEGGHANAAEKDKVVIQVSEKDPTRWNLSLNNAKNVQTALGGVDKVDIEIVAYGPGIGMLTLGSEVGGRVDEAVNNGIKVVACQNTMRHAKLTEGDMLPGIGYVPSGVVEIMQKQKQGYDYIRP